MNGLRRQSMWYGSVGSVPSSNGSISYTSPQQAMAHPSALYQHQQSSPPPMQQPAYGAPVRQQTSPQGIPPQPQIYQPQQQAMPPPQMYGQHAPPQHYQQQFSFNEPVYHGNQVHATAPNQQFAAWGGYGGPAVANTLDEENAVPPKSNPWDISRKK